MVEQPQYQLPRTIEHHLATLSKLYAQEGERLRQEIIVNAQARVDAGWSIDNWNGGTYGHALYLAVPEDLYLVLVRQKEQLQDQIKVDINRIHNVQNEFIEEVFIEMEQVEDRDWRRESGVLKSRARVIPPDATKRIWGHAGYKVFLSHKAEVKKETAELKERLRVFGASCFVAHQDIHPTKEWQEEIEYALASMEAFVALMTSDFHDSDWTDQEVGIALGRGVPIVAVKLGMDPYGFIGKFQALQANWTDAHKGIIRLLINQPRMLDAFLSSVESCGSWGDGNLLATALPGIECLTDEQAQRLVAAYNNNSEVRGSLGFNGTQPSFHGPGLQIHISRITGRQATRADDGTLEFP